MYLGRFENRIDILRAAVDHALESWGCMKRNPTHCHKKYINLEERMLNVKVFLFKSW